MERIAPYGSIRRRVLLQGELFITNRMYARAPRRDLAVRFGAVGPNQNPRFIHVDVYYKYGNN